MTSPPFAGTLARRLAGAILVAVALCLGAPAGAQDFPALTGRVVDDAGLVDAATEEAITGKLADFETRSSDQVVVATVPDLGGYEIADYGYRLGREWGIGREGEDNGVILLVSRDDREVRIEVGYGLEGTLTDALSRAIIETDIVPRFKADDYPGGIAAGVDAILAVLSGNAAEIEARAARAAQWTGEDTEAVLGVLLFVGIWVLVIGMVVLGLLSRRFGQKTGPNTWRWLGMTWSTGSTSVSRGSGWSSGGSSFGSSSGGGFSGGGGSFGGGGASGSW